jgi:hypothetical protein
VPYMQEKQGLDKADDVIQGAKEAAKKVAVANSTIPGLRRGILSVVPDGTGFWAEIQFPGLRPGVLSVVPTDWFLGWDPVPRTCVRD